MNEGSPFLFGALCLNFRTFVLLGHDPKVPKSKGTCPGNTRSFLACPLGTATFFEDHRVYPEILLLKE